MNHQILAAAIAALLATGATAQDSDSPFVTFQVLKPEVALKLARAALQACRDGGYQVGVTVVDRFGIPQVYLRDRYAGMHVFETSRRKAWTAVSFKGSTLDLDVATRPFGISGAIRNISEALPLGGGLPVLNGDGSIVAGIGVSGAPGPDLDDHCAKAGISAIEDEIAF